METPENAIVINGSWSKKLRLEQEEDLFKKTEVGDPIELNWISSRWKIMW